MINKTPEQCGIKSEYLEKLIDKYICSKENSEIHSFMLLRHGAKVIEGYFAPYKKEYEHTLYSVSKMFVSCAAGFAVGEGLFDIEDNIVDYFPEFLPEDISPKITEIKIKHLLSMCFGQEGIAVHKVNDMEYDKSDMRYLFFRRNMATEPGTVFSYDKYGSYMVSALIQKLTGQNLIEYLTPRLLKPLDIEIPYYEKDENGICIGSSGTRITLEALAKIGQCYLDGGVWEGKQILNKDWLDIATKAHINTLNCATGENWQQGYCFQFWRGKHNTYRFCGAYGQMCVIMPDYDAIFAVNSGYSNNELSYILESFYEEVMFKMEDGELPENKEAFERLCKKAENLSLKEKYSDVSPLYREIDGITIPCEDPFGYDSIRIDFKEDCCDVVLNCCGKEKIKFSAGFKAPILTPIDDSEFVSKGYPDKAIYSATAYWENDNEFNINVRLVKTATIVKIKVTVGENSTSEISKIR